MSLSYEYLFQDSGIIDVTRFDESPEDPEMGYMCSGTIAVLSNGSISIQDGKKELERITMDDVIRFTTNDIRQSPDDLPEIHLITQTRGIRISFADSGTKNRFLDALDQIIPGQ